MNGTVGAGAGDRPESRTRVEIEVTTAERTRLEAIVTDRNNPQRHVSGPGSFWRPGWLRQEDGITAAHLAALGSDLRLGGVGIYATYIHLDTGPQRFWSG
jgi:hypothetical protein